MSDNTKRRQRKSQGLKATMLAILSIIIVLTCAIISVFVIDRLFYATEDKTSSEIVGSGSEEILEEPKPVTKVSTATVAATGDLLMHEPIITCSSDGNGKYNFDKIFTYFKKYTTDVNYAVANLETTLRGNKDGYKFSGYPQFNCPDEIVESVKSAGFDMLLTANNHSYDTRYKGMIRTLEVIDNNGLDRIGSVKSDSEKPYIVKNINDINIGMICYTYETEPDESKVALNGIPLSNDAKKIINAFSYEELDKFYKEMTDNIANLKKDGAEAIVVFLHWGNEYSIKQSKAQEGIAQTLCNLGVDVIVGGHPHVIQPMDLLTSESDNSHKTVCLYSTGNAVSNQRKERMNLKTGHTEDGVLFSFTFAKYSDGKVILEKADVMPTWVNMFNSSKSNKKVYQIIPLDSNVPDWKQAFNLTDISEKAARNSYDRTVKIIGEGLKKVNDYLSSSENSYPNNSKSSGQISMDMIE